MATEPASEAYEAAVQAYRTQRTHVRPHDPDGMRAAIAAVWPLAEARVRAKVAAEIRAGAGQLAVRAEVMAGVSVGAADDHPLMLGLEFDARIAEGKGDET